MHWMFLPFFRYAEFSGRSRRREFWSFQLLNMIVVALCLIPIIAGIGINKPFDDLDIYSANQSEFNRQSASSFAMQKVAAQKVAVQSAGKRSCEPFCGSSTPSDTYADEDFVFDGDERGSAFFAGNDGNSTLVASLGFIALAIWWLAILIPQMAVTVRRLHDINLSGKLLIPIYLGMAVPVLGSLVSCVYIGLMMVAGSKGRNDYGDDPKLDRPHAAVFA